MLALLLHPFVLCILVAIVGRSSTDFDFPRMFFIALGVGLFAALLNAILPGLLALLGIILVCCLLTYLLMKYCGLTLQQALIVTALYIAYQVGFALLLTSMFAPRPSG